MAYKDVDGNDVDGNGRALPSPQPAPPMNHCRHCGGETTNTGTVVLCNPCFKDYLDKNCDDVKPCWHHPERNQPAPRERAAGIK